MIVLGNSEFALGMKFAGVEKSYAINDKEQGKMILETLDKEEIMIVNVSVMNLFPELKEYANIVSIPDEPSEMNNIEDLHHIIRDAVGLDVLDTR